MENYIWTPVLKRDIVLNLKIVTFISAYTFDGNMLNDNSILTLGPKTTDD